MPFRWPCIMCVSESVAEIIVPGAASCGQNIYPAGHSHRVGRGGQAHGLAATPQHRQVPGTAHDHTVVDLQRHTVPRAPHDGLGAGPAVDGHHDAAVGRRDPPGGLPGMVCIDEGVPRPPLWERSQTLPSTRTAHEAIAPCRVVGVRSCRRRSGRRAACRHRGGHRRRRGQRAGRPRIRQPHGHRRQPRDLGQRPRHPRGRRPAGGRGRAADALPRRLVLRHLPLGRPHRPRRLRRTQHGLRHVHGAACGGRARSRW